MRFETEIAGALYRGEDGGSRVRGRSKEREPVPCPLSIAPPPPHIPVLPSLPWFIASSLSEKLCLEEETIVMGAGLGGTGEWSCKSLTVKNSILPISWGAWE